MIIITAKVHPYLMETFQKKGFSYEYLPEITYDELYNKIESATGLVVTTRLKIDKRIIDKAVSLKWIGRLGSGMELIDVEYARKKNIFCESSPEGNRTAVAEHALGMLLSLMRNIKKSANEVSEHKWIREGNRGTELTGKVIGIIGFGNTGQAFSNLLSAFNVKVLAYDKYKSGFGNSFVKESSIEEIIDRAEIISFHVPLTEETKHMANEQFFNALKKNPYFINTSRGEVVDTVSLTNALKNKQISAAALDVFENENLSSYNENEKKLFDYLNSCQNVLLTPHIAGYTHEAFYKMSRILLEKLGMS